MCEMKAKVEKNLLMITICGKAITVPYLSFSRVEQYIESKG